jgi:hypothetical protein
MRWLLVLGLVASCVSGVPHRPLVVDNVPYGANRSDIRAWHLHHGWCMGRVWATTDEFVRCDERPEANPTDPPIFDPQGEGMFVDLADRLRAIDRQGHPRRYANLLFDALAPELDRRCGRRTWEADRDFGATWQTKRTEIGLFVSSNGHWIIETHEIRPEQLWNVHLARTE